LKDVLELSQEAWGPVFLRMEPTVPSFVYESFYPECWQTRQTHDLTTFLQAEGGNAFVALTGDAVVRWIGLRLHFEDSMGEFYVLAVDPEYQGQGVAQAMMRFAADTFVRQA
jgi:ribosomal protein S18 acetylase RimI-like enzyme